MACAVASTCFGEQFDNGDDDDNNNNRRFVIIQVAQVPRSSEGTGATTQRNARGRSLEKMSGNQVPAPLGTRSVSARCLVSTRNHSGDPR